jgi:cyclophilin family peptidyl-prolyl cis-trans isomerase
MCLSIGLLVAGLAIATPLVLGGAGKRDDKSAQASPATPTPTPAAPKPADPAKDELLFVTLKTSKGDIVLELNRSKAPLSVDNFVKYVDDGFYNGTVFHRVINNFMIQGGGFTPDGAQKATRDPIKNEWKNGLKNVRYSIAMARTNVADSATSQFYINVVDNAALDTPRDGAAYAVFGRVIAGTDVVDAIKAVPTGRKRTPKGEMPDWPTTDVTITSATRITAEDAAKLTKK